MSLAMIGQGASYEFRWRVWALLRDVVAANLDEATLPAFCAIGDAMVEGSLRVDARALATELAQIRTWLAGKPVDSLVIGPRTSALVYMTKVVPERRALSLGEIDRIRPIADSSDLAEYFATMLDSMEHVCTHPQPDGTVEIIDG
jgi:hypothetical protein